MDETKNSHLGSLLADILTIVTTLNGVEFVVSFGCKSPKNTPLKLYNTFIYK